ncbi:hypothetical protein EHS25_007971 [Saitozyma podzolica]|uniref:Uncharacterized protein n=1 Tax=Saitozyma podzolica TaxID=1890683 RepID=A0A427XKY3_9TREE|nr:hypothetical protein EHS25_007971 [Saitozyma podzolica]
MSNVARRPATSGGSKSTTWNSLGAGAVLALAQGAAKEFHAFFRRVAGFYQGLIPWAWLEASTKGALLLVSSGETERLVLQALPGQKAFAGAAGGVVGGLKTAEITRNKMKSTGVTPPSTWAVCRDIYQREGIRGLNKGANAVALRQMTGWASRIGLTRVNESFVRWATGKGQGDKLSAGEKIFSSCAGGALSCWNQPFESLIPSALHQGGYRPTALETAKYIVKTNGVLGLFRGITPRIMLAASVTAFMVAGGDLFINYARTQGNLNTVRKILRRPLTYAEKIIYGHLDDPHLPVAAFDTGKYLKLRPSRVACQDATAQNMALLQFLTTGLPAVRTPTTIHCDHLIVAKDGVETDLPNAALSNKEVYDFRGA